MEQQIKTTFAILGGGIAGLSTAIALKKIGIDALVLEAAPEFKPVGAGITLAVNAMKAYDHLGIKEEITSAGRPFKILDLLTQEGKVISKTDTGLIEDHYTNIAIHRRNLHDRLLAQLDRDQIKNGKRTHSFVKKDDQYQIECKDGTTIEAKYVIIAEGIHSPIRQQLLPNAKQRYSGYTCWRGIADNSQLEWNQTSETWGKKGRFGIVPLKDDQLYWFAVVNGPEESEELKKTDRLQLFEWFGNYHYPIKAIIEATQEKNIFHNDIKDLQPITQFAFDNIVLVGDSAHATTPNMGQGACQAIEDAVILAECLKKHSIASEAFRAYENKRIKRTHFIVNQSWKIGKVGQWEHPVMIRLRNALFRLLPASFFHKQIREVYNFQVN